MPVKILIAVVKMMSGCAGLNSRNSIGWVLVKAWSVYLQAHGLILFRKNWMLLLRELDSYILSNKDQVDVFTLKNRIAE